MMIYLYLKNCVIDSVFNQLFEIRKFQQEFQTQFFGKFQN
jgi:hypothetical protein